MIQVTYAAIKTFIQARGLSPQTWVDGENLCIMAIDGPLCFFTSIWNDTSNSDKADFDSNFGTIQNKKLESKDPSGYPMTRPTPFASKTIEGLKIFRRVHGVTGTLNPNGDTVIMLIVPYLKAKINKLELLWLPEGVTVDFKVYDTPTGTISTVPNFMLNQFGFGAAISKDWHEDESDYDADLIQNMKIECTLHNPTNVVKTVGVNFHLHEVK
jgi:hypothetical protein